MNKDEIKKALECCSNPNTGSCKDCPYNYNDEFHCAYGEMCKDALNLINEQETEIEKGEESGRHDRHFTPNDNKLEIIVVKDLQEVEK